MDLFQLCLMMKNKEPPNLTEATCRMQPSSITQEERPHKILSSSPRIQKKSCHPGRSHEARAEGRRGRGWRWPRWRRGSSRGHRRARASGCRAWPAGGWRSWARRRPCLPQPAPCLPQHCRLLLRHARPPSPRARVHHLRRLRPVAGQHRWGGGTLAAGSPRSSYSSAPLPRALDSARFEEELSRASWRKERGGFRGGGGEGATAMRVRRRRTGGGDPRRGRERDAFHFLGK